VIFPSFGRRPSPTAIGTAFLTGRSSEDSAGAPAGPPASAAFNRARAMQRDLDGVRAQLEALCDLARAEIGTIAQADQVPIALAELADRRLDRQAVGGGVLHLPRARPVRRVRAGQQLRVVEWIAGGERSAHRTHSFGAGGRLYPAVRSAVISPCRGLSVAALTNACRR